MKVSSETQHNYYGFTLIEVISVLMIIGIISAVVISRAGSADVYRLVSETETLKVHLRYAQFRAMSDTVSWGIEFNGNSYKLLKDEGDAPNHLPHEDSITHDLQDGVSVSGSTVHFSSCWGSPGDSDISITLSADGHSETVTITKNTGFIQ
jgi:MSHA pilin protein MshC